jgi:hypothetical protein
VTTGIFLAIKGKKKGTGKRKKKEGKKKGTGKK